MLLGKIAEVPVLMLVDSGATHTSCQTHWQEPWVSRLRKHRLGTLPWVMGTKLSHLGSVEIWLC